MMKCNSLITIAIVAASLFQVVLGQSKSFTGDEASLQVSMERSLKWGRVGGYGYGRGIYRRRRPYYGYNPYSSPYGSQYPYYTSPTVVGNPDVVVLPTTGVTCPTGVVELDLYFFEGYPCYKGYKSGPVYYIAAPPTSPPTAAPTAASV